MEWLLYNEDRNELRVIDEFYLLTLRDLFDDPSADPDFQEELEWLADQGWIEASPLTIAMYMGEVTDEASMIAWRRNHSANLDTSAIPALSGDGISSLADAIRCLIETGVHKTTPKVESPYLTKEEAAEYLRTTVDGIYGRVERGQLQRCPGVREYLFTKEHLDDSVMGRVAKPLRGKKK